MGDMRFVSTLYHDSPDHALGAALALRGVSGLRQTYPSRQAYREFWRTQPHFPPEEWNPWIEAFLDYEVGGESPVQKSRKRPRPECAPI